MLHRTSLGIRILLGLRNEHKETHVSENQGRTFRVRHVQPLILRPLTIGMAPGSGYCFNKAASTPSLTDC